MVMILLLPRIFLIEGMKLEPQAILFHKQAIDGTIYERKLRFVLQVKSARKVAHQLIC